MDRFKNRVGVPTIITEEQKIKYFSAPLNINGFLINTNPTSGALEVKPQTAPPNQPPASVALPASLVLDLSGMSIQPSAEFGARILLETLLTNLMNLEINIEGLDRMPLRSVFNLLVSRVAGAEANITDISGVRIPAILTEQLSNAALDAAREAAQLLKDQVQDASGALIALSAATAASDIAGLSGRVTALEAAPGFDATSINAAIATLQTDVAAKADASALASYALGSDLAALDTRVGAAESGLTGAGSRLDAVEAGVASKVATADYNIYVASNDAAVAAVVTSVAAKADASALASYALAADVEAKGRLTAIDSEVVSFTGINNAYWGGLIQQIRTALGAGKLAVVDYNDGAGLSFFMGLTPSTAQAYRIKNAGTYAISFNPGSEAAPAPDSIEVAAGETITFLWNGSAWLLA